MSAQNAIAFSLVMVVVVDCVMTLFGSTANDAAFNAWITDNTKPSYRGSVESIVSILPLIALLVVAGGIGALKESLGYQAVFIGLGAVVSICGVVGIFLFRDAENISKSGGFGDILYGFRPSVIKSHLPFYATLLSVAIFGIAIQTFMSYLIIFMEHYLGFSVMEYSVVFAVAILAGAGVNIYLGKLSDRMEKSKLLYSAVAILAGGLAIMYLSTFIDKSNKLLLMLVFGFGGFVMICGNIFSTALNGSILRDNTPEGSAGKMQGIRMVASVLIPMLVGPAIGNAINKAQNVTLENAGANAITTELLPAPGIFLAGMVVTLFALAVVPLIRKAEAMSKE
jgi:MFS family permease